jgi:hypothetical protein
MTPHLHQAKRLFEKLVIVIARNMTANLRIYQACFKFSQKLVPSTHPCPSKEGRGLFSETCHDFAIIG